MYKYALTVFLALSIISCSPEDQEAFDDAIEVIDFFQGDDDTGGIGSNLQGATFNTGINESTGNNIQSVSGTGETTTVSSANKVDLVVAGSNNTVNIETNLGDLRVSGSNNLLNFSPNVSVDVCLVGGSDNSIQKDSSVTLTCEVTGSGNIGF